MANERSISLRCLWAVRMKLIKQLKLAYQRQIINNIRPVMWLATSNKRVVFDSTQTALIRYQLWPEQECRKESNLTLYFLYLCNNTAKLLFIIFKSLPIYCPNQRVFICAKLFSFQLFKAQNGHYEIKQHTCLLLQNVLIFNKNLNDKISMDIVYISRRLNTFLI